MCGAASGRTVESMRNDIGNRPDHAVAKGVTALVVVVVVLNVLPRLVPVPDMGLSLPDVPAAPDFPGWVDGILRAIVKIKNWALLVLVALAVTGAIQEGRKRSRPPEERSEPQGDADAEGRS
jgi:hypothetical protein